MGRRQGDGGGMSEFPSMPLFAGDMLADTEHLTNEEFGVYHRLLYAMWRRNGWVPDDDRDLARICHVSPQKWVFLKRRMMQFLICKDGELSQKKLLKVRAGVAQICKKNAKNAHRRWHPDSNEINNMTDANGYAKSMHRARDSKTKTKISPNGDNARTRARPPDSKYRDFNDVLDEYINGTVGNETATPVINGSVERRDSGGTADIVQLHALSERHRS
jgi:uncharacterized protein YdaU (DUF1376 family)